MLQCACETHSAFSVRISKEIQAVGLIVLWGNLVAAYVYHLDVVITPHKIKYKPVTDSWGGLNLSSSSWLTTGFFLFIYWIPVLFFLFAIDTRGATLNDSQFIWCNLNKDPLEPLVLSLSHVFICVCFTLLTAAWFFSWSESNWSTSYLLSGGNMSCSSLPYLLPLLASSTLTQLIL